MTPQFLTIHDIFVIQRDQIQRYGGTLGVLNQGLAESAIAVPRATFGGSFLHGSIPAMAAAYVFHLVANHPFQDGNKRIGSASALLFLELNGFRLGATQEEYYDIVMKIAAGEIKKEEVVNFFVLKTLIRAT